MQRYKINTNYSHRDRGCFVVVLNNYKVAVFVERIEAEFYCKMRNYYLEKYNTTDVEQYDALQN